MKTLIKLCMIWLLCIGCQKKEPAIQLPECTCQDFEVSPDSTSYKGMIFYPENGYTSPYRIKLDYPRMSVEVCSDSNFLNQLKLKQIKDSTLVKFTYNMVLIGTIKKGVDCNRLNTGGDPTFLVRIVKIEKQ